MLSPPTPAQRVTAFLRRLCPPGHRGHTCFSITCQLAHTSALWAPSPPALGHTSLPAVTPVTVPHRLPAKLVTRIFTPTCSPPPAAWSQHSHLPPCPRLPDTPWSPAPPPLHPLVFPVSIGPYPLLCLPLPISESESLFLCLSLFLSSSGSFTPSQSLCLFFGVSVSLPLIALRLPSCVLHSLSVSSFLFSVPCCLL